MISAIYSPLYLHCRSMTRYMTFPSALVVGKEEVRALLVSMGVCACG